MYNSDVDRIFTFDQSEKNRYGNTGFGNARIAARKRIVYPRILSTTFPCTSVKRKWRPWYL